MIILYDSLNMLFAIVVDWRCEMRNQSQNKTAQHYNGKRKIQFIEGNEKLVLVSSMLSLQCNNCLKINWKTATN